MAYTNFTWVEKELLKTCKDNYLMVGTPRPYNFVRTNQTNNRVKLFFEPLCQEPLPILNSSNSEFVKSNYIAFDNYIDADFLPDYYDCDSYDIQERIDEIEKFYENKLVIFAPMYRINSDGTSFKNMQIIGTVELPERGYYYTIPKVDMDNGKFEEVLKNGEYFSLSDFDNRLIDGTEIVICGEFAYRFKNNVHDYSFLVGSESRSEAWKFSGGDEIVKVKYAEFCNYNGCLIEGLKSIYFVEDSLLQSLINTEKYISIDAQEKIVEMTPENDQPDGTDVFIPDSADEIEEIAEMDSEDEEKKALNASEITFINGLLQLTKSRNLVYEYKDLVNFHTSVKTNPLTIISGMSGTGKTQLAYNYARMLDLSEDNNTLLFMPISPSYSEPSDVLGYLNPMTNEYVPSETGLVDFLVHANTHKNKMHMVIFDEMNLSQVEYWFSPFISILEKDMGDRFLKLYDASALDNKKGTESETKKKYPPKIKIDDNVIFVGTVNVDETTKDFSDRLLDRTFVINLKKINFKTVFEGLKGTNKESDKVDISAAKCGDASVFMTWNKKYNMDHLDAFKNHPEELDFLDEFSELLSSTVHSDGISHRVFRNIGYYLLNVPETEDGYVIERPEAFDMIVNQTVMQKIRGTEAQLSSLIGARNGRSDSVDSSNLLNLLDKYSNVSKFENVRKTINKKVEDLCVNGYTN